MKIGIDERTFWTLTPWQIKVKTDAYTWRFDNRGEMQAHFTSLLISAWSEDTIQANDIYRRNDEERNEKTEEEHRREFEEITEYMGVDAIPVED